MFALFVVCIGTVAKNDGTDLATHEAVEEAPVAHEEAVSVSLASVTLTDTLDLIKRV